MTFQDFLTNAGDRLSDDPEMVARFEYVWNSAIRAAAGVCHDKAEAFGNPAHREAATICSEAVMELWEAPQLSLR